jgi:hypothetical protein
MDSRQYGYNSRLFSKWQDYRQMMVVVFFVLVSLIIARYLNKDYFVPTGSEAL